MKMYEFPGSLFRRIGEGQIETLAKSIILCRVSIRPIISPGTAEGELGWLRLVELTQIGPENPSFLEYYLDKKAATGGNVAEVKYAIWYQPTRFGGFILRSGDPTGRYLPENCQEGIILLTREEAILRILVKN